MKTSVMKLYYIRHGDPDYLNNCLTEYGKLQAKSLYEKVLKDITFDKIYVSPLGRAIQTAELGTNLPADQMIIKEVFSENISWKYRTLEEEPGKRQWLIYHKTLRPILNDSKTHQMGEEWVNLPIFENTLVKEGLSYYKENVDKFMEELGFKHDRENKRFIQIKNDIPHKVAIFAHGGAAMSVLSQILDESYPAFNTKLCGLDTSSVTIIDFEINDGIVYPRIQIYNDTAHLIGVQRPNDKRKMEN